MRLTFRFSCIADEKAFGDDGYGAKASNVLMQVCNFFILECVRLYTIDVGERKRFSSRENEEKARILSWWFNNSKLKFIQV